LATRFTKLAYFELGANASATDLEQVARAAANADQFLAAVIVKPAAWHHFGLPSWAVSWLQPLLARRTAVVACLGAPQGLEPFPGASAHICTFSDVPASQQALVEKLTQPVK
jgi:hypothetical protein